jgi:hypothetical protein
MRGRPKHLRVVGGAGFAPVVLTGVGACFAGRTRTVSEPVRVVRVPTEADVLDPPTPVGPVGDLFGHSCEIENPLCEQAARDLLQPPVAIALRPDGTPGLAAGFLVDGRCHWVFVPEAELDSLFRATAAPPATETGPLP